MANHRIKPAIERGGKNRPVKKSGTPLLLVLVLSLASLNSLANALKDNPSPYLAMHGSDPVNWRPWSADVLKQAQRENRLIFISSGYFSCYWCHRMQEDVYRHADAAAILNADTIPVKIDRELSPGLDHYLIDFAQRTTGRAGWPIHVLLTPEGYPFYAFMYQPKARFIAIVERAARLWRTDPGKIRTAARKALPQPKPYPTPPPPLTLTRAQLADQLHVALEGAMDDFAGGLKGQQKFPQTPLYLSLLTLSQWPDHIKEWFTLSLDAMANQHLRDHVNGGFFRYTVDPDWHTPHYEKMLYDNAQLATLYLRAGKRFNRADWVAVGLETLRFLDRHLYNPKTGLYFGSLSATDAHHHEGGTYLWDRNALKKHLPADLYQAADAAWGLDGVGPWDGKWLPAPFEGDAWPAIRRILAEHSVQPARDSKQVIGWNALMVDALVAATDTTGDLQWRVRAVALYSKLSRQLRMEHPPRALNDDGSPMGQATLQDYVLTIAAGETLGEDTVPLRQRMARDFLTPSGWKLSAAPLLPGQNGLKWLADGALPSLTAIADSPYLAHVAAVQTRLQQAPLQSHSYLRYNTLASSP